jgi:hypothetical protein
MSDLIDKTAALKIAQDIGYLDYPDSIAYAVSDAIAALPADPCVAKLVEALREIASITVHSGGDIHGVDRNMWKQAFCQAQDEARAALAAWETDHE